MIQFEKRSVSVDIGEESEKSLKYVLSLAKEVDAQFIVLQVLGEKVEKYSIVFPVVLLEKWPFAAKSVPTIPLSAVLGEEFVDLAGIVARITSGKRQRRIQSRGQGDHVVKILATTFSDDKIDMVIFELGTRLPLPHRVAVDFLMAIKDLPYPVLLSSPPVKGSHESGEPLHALPPDKGEGGVYRRISEWPDELMHGRQGRSLRPH